MSIVLRLILSILILEFLYDSFNFSYVINQHKFLKSKTYSVNKKHEKRGVVTVMFLSSSFSTNIYKKTYIYLFRFFL